MNKFTKTIAVFAVAGAGVGILAGCQAADVVDHNTTVDAKNFKIERRIELINGITDRVILEVEGRCNITDETGGESGANQLEILCKTGEDEYKKHMLGLSDNVTYLVEQIEPHEQDEYHYQWNVRPETVIPDVEVDTSAGTVGDGGEDD